MAKTTSVVKLSICIPTYNRALYLKECLESVISSLQGYEDKIEIVISDNASIDETPFLVKEFSKKYPFIRYNRNPTNVYDENFFIVAKLSCGEYIWIFGDDDKMEKNAISEVMQKINLGYNFIVCNYSIWDKNMKRMIKPFNYRFGYDFQFSNPEKLMRMFGIKLQFISSLVIKREIFFSADEREYSFFHEYGNSFLFAVYSGIKKDLRGIFISKPILKYRGFNSDLTTVESWYKRFSIGSALVLSSLRKKGYSFWSIFWAKNKVLLDYIAKDIVFRRKNRQRIKKILKLTFPYYKFNLFFWIVIFPLFFIPVQLLNLAKKFWIKLHKDKW